MFWKVSTFSSGSAVEGILDKQNFTLEELLDEDELVQECKSLNARLIAYLKQEKVLDKLITFVTNPPKSWATERQQQRFPFIACEVLCCEVDGIFDTLVKSKDLLGELFTFLDQDTLNKSRAAYFLRIIVSLLTKCSAPVMEYVHGQPWILRRAVELIDNFSMLECLQNLLGAADNSPGNAAASDLQWLTSTTVLPDLLSKLSLEADCASRENAGKLLTHIGRSRNCPLTALLPSPQHLQPMLEQAFEAQHGTQLKQALHVCIALLDRQHPQQAPGQSLRQSVERAAAAAAELDSKLEAETIEGVCHHAHRLAALLDVAPHMAELGTSYGVLQPPLGSSRLAVIALLDSLLNTGNLQAEQAIIESDAIPRCLKLVIEYPFNSILHHLVRGILTKALASGPSSLLTYLFQQCHLMQWLLTLPIEVTPQQPADTPKAKKRLLRAGYMGHVTQLANMLQIASDERIEVAEHVTHDPDWQHYLTSSLHPQNEKQDVEAWSFGRPEAKSSKRGAEDNYVQEDVPLIMENGASPDTNGTHDRYGSLEYDEEDHILFQQQQGVDDNVTFDSDEEDDSAANGNEVDHSGLASFPVDNWEDTWDDSDAPVSGQLGEGWGEMANQLYQHHWDTNEHSGWSDEDDHDPDLPLDHANDDDHDDSVVMVDDNDDMDDGDAVMVDALEALRLTQPHTLQPDRLSQLTQAAEAAAADRPHTAQGGTRHQTPTAAFSHDFNVATLEDDNYHPNADADDSDEADQHEEADRASEGHAETPRHITANSIWALFADGKDRSVPNADKASVSTSAAATDAGNTDTAAGPDSADTQDNAHVSRSGTSADSEESISNVLEGEPAGGLEAVNVSSEVAESSQLDSSEKYADRSAANENERDEKRQHDRARQSQNTDSIEHEDDADAFNSSQFWRTPLIVPDDIENA